MDQNLIIAPRVITKTTVEPDQQVIPNLPVVKDSDSSSNSNSQPIKSSESKSHGTSTVKNSSQISVSQNSSENPEPRVLTTKRKRRKIRSFKGDGIVIKQKKVNHIKIYQFNNTINVPVLKSDSTQVRSENSLDLMRKKLGPHVIDKAFNLGDLEEVNRVQYLPKQNDFDNHPMGIQPLADIYPFRQNPDYEPQSVSQCSDSQNRSNDPYITYIVKGSHIDSEDM